MFSLHSNEVCGKEYVLFKDGRSDYKIVTSSSADEVTQYAANELQYWLKKIGGVELPLTELGRANTKRIIVGDCKDIGLLTFVSTRLEEDSYCYFNKGSDIVICGSGRGVMYGVFALLKNEFGCRWYTIDCENIPQRREYHFSELNYESSPAFRIRNVFYYDAWKPEWRIRNGLNQLHAYPPREARKIVGGSYIICGAHTFDYFVPKVKYYNNHPEYFSLVNGKRISGKSQLCLSNPEVLRLCTEGMLDYIKQYPDYYAYCLSQNDCLKPCECNECKKLLDKYGTQSGVMIWFVNKVADAVKNIYPDKLISTYAYQYTKQPPHNIKPRDNVLIELCDIDECCVHKWEDCEENKDFLEALQGWTAISKNIYVSDYVSNYMEYFLPVPNFHVFQSRMKKCKELGCAGVRAYGVNTEPDGELAALKTYVLAQLLWDPNQDVEVLVDDFIGYYYGSSAIYVKQYYDLLQSSVRSDIHMRNKDSFNHPMYDDNLISRMQYILDKAVSVADNQIVKNRVEVLQLSPAYLTCRKYPQKAIKDGSYNLIHRVFERDKLTRHGEGVSVDKFEDAMNSTIGQKTNETLSLWDSFANFILKLIGN